jgi:hypothetical protein
VPPPDDPVCEDWSLVRGAPGVTGEVVCPRCILLPELAA